MVDYLGSPVIIIFIHSVKRSRRLKAN